MKPIRTITSCLLFLLLITGCEKEPIGPANLVVSEVLFTETFYQKLLDLPPGVYQPDNPNFHPDRPDTWTGNMAKYVKHFRSYTATYSIQNTGPGIAYDTEIDIIFQFRNGDQEVKTGKIGNIEPDGNYSSSASISSINNELQECFGEAYWFEE